MTSAEFAACNVPGKTSHWSGWRVAGLSTAVVVPAVSPLTVVTAETASKQLRAVKSLWNVRRPPGSQVGLSAFFLPRFACT